MYTITPFYKQNQYNSHNFVLINFILHQVRKAIKVIFKLQLYNTVIIVLKLL